MWIYTRRCFGRHDSSAQVNKHSRGPGLNFGRRSLKALLCALLIGTFQLPIVVQSIHPAAAALATCAPVQGYFDGFDNNNDLTEGVGVEGVAVAIRGEEAALCPDNSPGNTSSTWGLISSPNYTGLAQDGYLRDPNHPGANYFYEYGANNAGNPVYWHPADRAGQTHTFYVRWAYSDFAGNGFYCGGGAVACFYFIIDSTIIASSNFNPYLVWGNNLTTAWPTQYEGETHEYGSDMEGRPTGGIAAVFSSPEWQQNNSQNNFTPTACIYEDSNTNPRYGINYYYDDGCRTWSIYTY